jgi:hypothetical protein
MARIVLDVVLVLLSAHALAKPVILFGVPYRVRRRALDKAYAGGRTSATKTADTVLVLLCVALVALLWATGWTSAAGFPTGLYVGAVLVQVFFHRFSTPVGPVFAPEPPVSPIKLMSYAIQEKPGRATRELIMMAVLFALSAALLIRDLIA